MAQFHAVIHKIFVCPSVNYVSAQIHLFIITIKRDRYNCIKFYWYTTWFWPRFCLAIQNFVCVLFKCLMSWDTSNFLVTLFQKIEEFCSKTACFISVNTVLSPKTFFKIFIYIWKMFCSLNNYVRLIDLHNWILRSRLLV